MRPVLCRAFALALISASIAGCTTTVDATRRGAVAYNRAFDDARNQILLLNILRARDGYPQQFSTISTVTGSMRPDMSVTGALENIILGGAEVFKPSGTYGFRNPSVTISPLETKEFRAGMMKPVSADIVSQLLAGGWSHDVVWHLVVDKLDCAGRAATTTFVDANTKWAIQAGPRVPVRTFVVPAHEGAKILREGAGDGLTVKVAKEQGAAETLTLEIEKPGDAAITGLKATGECAAPIPLGKIAFRSPEGMIHYLGAQLRAGNHNHYFKLGQARNRPPVHALVATDFRGTVYYIDNDRPTLETLALLATIIGFQTTDATLSSGKPALTVSP